MTEEPTPDQLEAQRCHDYFITFMSDIGSRVLKDLDLMFCRQSYVQGDSHHTAFNCGSREVVLYIRESIEKHRELQRLDKEEKESYA